MSPSIVAEFQSCKRRGRCCSKSSNCGGPLLAAFAVVGLSALSMFIVSSSVWRHTSASNLSRPLSYYAPAAAARFSRLSTRFNKLARDKISSRFLPYKDGTSLKTRVQNPKNGNTELRHNLGWRNDRRLHTSLRAFEQKSTDLVYSGAGSQYRVLNEEDMEEVGYATPADFYQLLGVDEKANKTEMKKAYRSIFRKCHPDVIGEEANEFCELVNIAYDILSDEKQRPIYDSELEAFKLIEGDQFDGRPKSQWGGCCNATENRAVFVDELTCIGCRMCNNVAPDTFGIEETWGRARVKTQWGNYEEDLADAIDSCPVDCIYWVQRRQLPLLEYIMGICNRVSVAAMMNGAAARDSPFARAETFLKTRKSAKVDSSLNLETNMIHNEKLQAAIARAWLQLPVNVRDTLWPQYSQFQDF
eukprot:CAMPEP_0184480084 /NCGR_PEP_ID=MMETSP0113_2-20130426/1579_1 /TAXON_ID=91329 /ORGANISM="Norrisiella sphaerica, Strain BC52" /LENGTH=415 /DNA_ID=CAMNT_0026858345 /DNA_START=161 /DNA_END=1408 /DNA_ORIENTATION=+